MSQSQKAARQPPFKAAPGLMDDEEDLSPSQILARDVWNWDMDAAPKDGSEVALRFERKSTDYRVCIWRRSKRVSNFKWVNHEAWSDALNKQMLHDFVPVAWARYDIIDGLKKGV